MNSAFKFSAEPALIDAARFTDDRGSLAFINSLDLQHFRRFYTIENHAQHFRRAWHGHMLESKLFFPIQGSFLVAAVKMTDVINPNKLETVHRVVLSEANPKGFFVPKGYANGTMSLTADAKILVLSSTTLEESANDDYRFPADYWNPWEIEYR